MSSRWLLGNCKVYVIHSQSFYYQEMAILGFMRRVSGVKKNAGILLTGFIVGLIIWFQVVSSPADAAAFTVDTPNTQDQKSDQLAVDSLASVPAQVPTAMASVDSISTSSSDAEVLTGAQRQRLYEVSKKFIAETPADGNRIARSLNIVKNDGDPTNICGPLSIAILRDAKIIDPYIDLRDYWLLNPDINHKLLDHTFPAERFAHFLFSGPINEMDWKVFPLKPGDFIYLYAGPGGTFEHMLTVNRVDEAGRAFAVTNHSTPNGFVIDEVILYDPAHPGTGKFYDWTVRKNNSLGSTGFGGFELWRLIQPVIEKNPREQAITNDLDSLMNRHGGEWHVAIKKIDGGMIYERQADVSVDFGSMIKIPIAMLFFKSLETAGVPPEHYHEFLAKEGPSRTYEQLLRAMMVKSENEATRALLTSAYDNGLDVKAALSDWGLKDTRLESGKSSVNDLVILYDALYAGDLINQEAKNYILDLMEEGSSDKTTRLGVLQKTNPLSVNFYNRRGSTLDTVIAIGDSAIISVPVVDGEDSYIVVMFGYFNDDFPTTDQELISAIEEMAQVFWSFTKN
jgi:hypothetical protein